MKLSRYEQETVILYNQAEQTANIYTHDPRLQKKLASLAVKYPEQVKPSGPNRYLVPKGCVLVREPYSEERRSAAREKAKAAGAKPPSRGTDPKSQK